ncbi:hypothetical protein OHC50_08260 [Paenarthrobacter ilicis]|uniref:hypothetical protein n=1 Tax=Paenarthrobacter ilicis TaxID=43665 RepID=UPI0030092C57
MPIDPLPVPFELEGGWPATIPGTAVIAFEAGITLGGIDLSDQSLASLRGGRTLSLRIDEAPPPSIGFVVPTSPIRIPDSALENYRSLNDWVMDTHGGVGRLLVWNEGMDWWLVNDADLELTLICSQPSRFSAEFEEWSDSPFEWVDEAIWGPRGIREIEAIAQRYALNWNL